MIMENIYETLLRLTDMTGGRFTALYKLTVSELCSEFGEKYVLKNPDNSIDVSLPAECNLCFPEYSGAIINNIMYLDNPEKSIFKELSISQRAEAYTSVWRRICKIKPGRPVKWL